MNPPLAPARAPARRPFLQAFGSFAALAGLAGLLKPAALLAVELPPAAFQARTLADALRLIDAAGAEASTEILLTAPEVAENGASVPIEVISRLPGTTRIALLVDDNPFPLALELFFAASAAPRFQTRIKMAGTMAGNSRLRVVVTADGRHYTRVRAVQVIEGGCGNGGSAA